MGFTCLACAQVFTERAEQVSHYKKDWHRFNLKRKTAGVGPITEDAFERRRLAALAEAGIVPESAPAPVEPAPVKEDGGDGEESKHEPVGEGEEEGKGEEEEELLEVSQLNCAFCSNISDTLDGNLAHMVEAHSFVVPDVDFLKDLEGLVLYLIEKVYIGNLCLYCNSSFTSHYAVKQHMLDKSHCKLRYETPEDIDEYAEFYDFPAAAAAPVDADDLAESASVGAEITLTSGKTLGHRKYHRYYKQKYTGGFELAPFSFSKPSAVLAERAKIQARKPREKFEKTRARYQLGTSIRSNKLQGKYFRLQVIQ